MLTPETQLDISTTTNQSQQEQQQQQNQNTNPNPLNDHDYCSPNKDSTKKQKRQQLGDSNKSSNKGSKIFSDNSSDNSSSLTSKPVESIASTSLTPDLDNKQQKSAQAVSKQSSNDNLSNSPSSSSPSSSSSLPSSSLVIVQEQQRKLHTKPIAPQDTPSIKRKPGRPPVVKTREMDTSLVQESLVARKRERPVRQSTSVTDKSQWITGDDEIDTALSEHLTGTEPKEKLVKTFKELNPETYTSSDYSSSDAESDEDQGSDYNSEDDPDRLWCLCQKPHDGKFMISCDACKDWFHGHCVGITKLMGDRFEKEGKEWFCGECQEQMRNGTPRNAIQRKRVKKEKKRSQSTSRKRGRGRPKKSETSMREISTRLSSRSTRKSNSSLDFKSGVDNSRLKKNLAKPDAGSTSLTEFEDSNRLKSLIKERKKAFFYKRQLAAQEKAARRNELGLGNKQSLTAKLSESLDSLATTTNTPNMNNLPINIKERLKPNIVLQINIKKDSTTDQDNSSSRIVTTIVRSLKKVKHTESNNPIVNDLFTADPIQINKKVKTTPENPVTTGPTSNPTTGDTTNNSPNGETGVSRKRSNSSSSPIKKEKHRDSEKSGGETPLVKKKRKDSESSIPNGSSGGSQHYIQKIRETLETRCKQISDLEVSTEKIKKIATEIEKKLNEFFKEGTSKYRNKFASIILNLRDRKNDGLAKNVLTEEITANRLVNMSSDELASSELANWREQEKKHSIELIKRDAQMAIQQVIVKKTHKGEEVISAPQPNEPDDPSVTMDTQETPTTPTKSTPSKLSTKDIPRVDGSKITLTPPVFKPPTIKPMDLDSLMDETPEESFEDVVSSYSNKTSSSASIETPEQCWSGTITMPDTAKFSASAKSISGQIEFKSEDFSENLQVCGRIPPEHVQGYIKKLKSTTKNQIIMIQLFPLTEDDRANFDIFFDYLFTRNRYGVIQTNPQALKDFYILPIHEKGSVPEILRSAIKGQGIDRKEPNCLLGLMVRNKRLPTTSTSSSEQTAIYIPTPIN